MLLKSEVYDWCSHFMIQNESKTSCTSGICGWVGTEDDIHKVHKLIVDTRRINVRDIVNKLEISIDSVEIIIHLDLYYRKITGFHAF